MSSAKLSFFSLHHINEPFSRQSMLNLSMQKWFTQAGARLFIFLSFLTFSPMLTQALPLHLASRGEGDYDASILWGVETAADSIGWAVGKAVEIFSGGESAPVTPNVLQMRPTTDQPPAVYPGDFRTNPVYQDNVPKDQPDRPDFIPPPKRDPDVGGQGGLTAAPSSQPPLSDYIPPHPNPPSQPGQDPPSAQPESW